LWLLRWLLFRLMVSSALVKLTSGDPTWRHLTALTWHYETQPLPPWTAWYAHQLPAAFHELSAIVLFMIEGLAPFLLIGPRRMRFTAAFALIGLQILIFVTGNYGVFNLLAIALCLLQLDDGVWPAWLRVRLAPGALPVRGARWPNRILRPVAMALAVLGLVPLLSALRRPMPWLAPVAAVHRMIAPWEISNGYGLFAVMTTERNEIVVEGSADGVAWRPYGFRYKPGDLGRRPEFVAPHMPRLDWQMWFASLGDARSETWFLRFCECLLKGARPVSSLLATNPFGTIPPRYVRATSWRYHFTDAATRRRTGMWWRRELRGLYCPVLTLEGGQLAAVAVDSVGNVAR
jgi:hypothetical protein